MRTAATTFSLACCTLVALAACSSKKDCSCTYICDGGALYCWAEGDATVCTADVWQPRRTIEPSSDTAPVADASRPPDLVSDSAFPSEEVTVDTGADSQTDTVAPPYGEFRGIWVTRWDFNDSQMVAEIMAKVASMGFNAVMFQVRGRADAFYDSTLEPWAKELTGTLGQDPGWDPLAVAIEEGHKHGLEVHAWINTFTAWSGNSPPADSQPQHILNAHPDWLMVTEDGNPMAYNDSYVFVSPGIPAVRQHIINVALDVVTGYDVDGFHFDYIRYAGPQYSHDQPSKAAFASARENDPDLAWGDFQRDQLSLFVSDAYTAITSVAPEVKVTAAVWGIYKQEFGWSGTSQGFYDYYQDSHRWIADGDLDAICPMIYWKMTTPKGGYTDFATLFDAHHGAVGDRHIYAGMNAEHPQFVQVTEQIEYQAANEGHGFVIFAYATVHSSGFDMLLPDYLGPTPPTPPMPWKSQ